ncbi:MAG: hypothetical protein RL448_487 [Actinomycetota bacterium]|jgi:hypothetical protein
MKLTYENKPSNEFRPKLKCGASAVNLDSGSIFVGHFGHGIEVTGTQVSLLHAMNGRRSIAQLAQYTGTPSETVSNLVELLIENSLIDVHWPKLLVEGRYQSDIPNRPTHDGDFSEDGAVKELSKRLKPELIQASWRKSCIDGGRNLIAKRQDFAINIHGDFHVGIELLSGLLRSGFARAEIQYDRELRIDSSDLVSNQISHENFGSTRKNIVDRIVRESRVLGPMPQYEIPNFELNVAIGKVKNSDLQSWLSSNKSHLIVRLGLGPNIIIGPLVIPGKSPCFNCVSITEVENSIIWQGLHFADQYDKSFQLSSSTINLISSYLALAISQFADTKMSSLLGGAVIVDPNNPFELQTVKYPRHPNCGCAWNTLSSAH